MFYLISWISWTIHILFAILCIAAGLYYIAETIEEYTIYSKQIMQYMITSVLIILIICYFYESLPIAMFLSAFIANCVYYSLLEAFPYIEFTSLKFLVAVGMFVLKHYVALNYFADNFVPYLLGWPKFKKNQIKTKIQIFFFKNFAQPFPPRRSNRLLHRLPLDSPLHPFNFNFRR